MPSADCTIQSVQPSLSIRAAHRLSVAQEEVYRPTAAGEQGRLCRGGLLLLWQGKIPPPVAESAELLKGNEDEELDADMDVAMGQDDEVDAALPAALPNNVFQPMYSSKNLGKPASYPIHKS